MSIDCYVIEGGRYWDIAKSCFISDAGDSQCKPLYRNGKLADEAYLRQTLEFYGYAVGDELLTDEDRAKAAREKRDRLLAETDYLLMPDYPISSETLASLKAYRQALRDVPEQSGFPASIEWPTLELVEEA